MYFICPQFSFFFAKSCSILLFPRRAPAYPPAGILLVSFLFLFFFANFLFCSPVTALYDLSCRWIRPFPPRAHHSPLLTVSMAMICGKDCRAPRGCVCHLATCTASLCSSCQLTLWCILFYFVFAQLSFAVQSPCSHTTLLADRLTAILSPHAYHCPTTTITRAWW